MLKGEGLIMKKKHSRGLTPNAAGALLYIAQVLAALLATVILLMSSTSTKAVADCLALTAGDLSTFGRSAESNPQLNP